MYRNFGKVIDGRGGAAGKGDIGEVTSANSFAVFLGGANRGSEKRANGQGPFLPFHPKLTFSTFDEKFRT
jgi:hypothetical protein